MGSRNFRAGCRLPSPSLVASALAAVLHAGLGCGGDASSSERIEPGLVEVPPNLPDLPPPGGRESPSAGAESSDLCDPVCAECLEGQFVKWGASRIGRMTLDRDHWSELSTCNSYEHAFIFALANVDGPLPQCSVPVEGCPSLTLAVLNSRLKNPEFALPLDRRTVFGIDQRLAGGSIFQVSTPAGFFLVGAPCQGQQYCTEIPPAVSELVTQLQALDAVQLRQAPCAAMFPDGAATP